MESNFYSRIRLYLNDAICTNLNFYFKSELITERKLCYHSVCGIVSKALLTFLLSSLDQPRSSQMDENSGLLSAGSSAFLGTANGGLLQLGSVELEESGSA
jgi:hypothetical protein